MSRTLMGTDPMQLGRLADGDGTAGMRVEELLARLKEMRDARRDDRDDRDDEDEAPATDTGGAPDAPGGGPAVAPPVTVGYDVPPDVAFDDSTLHPAGCACHGCAGRDDPSENDTSIDTSTVSALQAGTLQELADYLRVGYWNDAGSIPRKYNLGSTGFNPNYGELTYDLNGFSNLLGITDSDGISNARKDLVREAFKLFEEVLGITFTGVNSNDADFYFSDNQSGAFAASTGYGSGIDYSVINVQASWSGGTSTYDDYTLQTIIHEIGHALGLGHQGFYNGSGSYSTSADFANDSWQASMMSYFSQTENTSINASYEFLQTPMSVDWLALNDIYGNDSYGGQDFGTENAFTGNTIYGFNTNITSAESDIWANFSSFANRTASTIIDGGGIDTLDVSGYSANQLIDLRVSDANDTAPTTMNIGGRTGNLTLAVGTVIENADGGSGNDTFYGNAAANSFRGNQGDDTFVDSAGGDSYRGGSGSDRVEFGSSFASYSFELAGDFLEVVDSAFSSVTDLVHDTIEFLDFTDQSLSFSSLVSGLSAPIPTATITAISDNRGSITGTIADGGATNDRSPTLSGTLDATLDTGQDLAVFRDGAKVGEASVNGTSWSFTDSGVQDGSRLYTVAVEDGGTTGQASAGYRITVDGTAPVVTVDAVSGEASSPALGGTVNDPTADVTVRVDGRTYDARNDGDGTWSLAAGTLTGLAPGDYDVAVTATDAVGNAGTDATSGELTITAPAPAPAPVAPSAVVAFGEVTVEQPNAATWFTVTFAETIPDAVVVMGPVTANGGQPASARVRNVTDEGFEFQIEEWDYLDGFHITETVGWMAASAGSYTVGGLSVQAGSTTAVNETWKSVDLDAGFDDAPVVLTQVASENDEAAVVTRTRSVQNDGFELQMQEEEVADGTHATEEIHWIAVESGNGTAFDAGTTANAVTDADFDILYGSSASADSVFVASMQTRDGGDVSNLRVRDSDANGATVFVDEEESRDSETAHIDEVVGYVVAEDGYWYA